MRSNVTEQKVVPDPAARLGALRRESRASSAPIRASGCGWSVLGMVHKDVDLAFAWANEACALLERARDCECGREVVSPRFRENPVTCKLAVIHDNVAAARRFSRVRKVVVRVHHHRDDVMRQLSRVGATPAVVVLENPIPLLTRFTLSSRLSPIVSVETT